MDLYLYSPAEQRIPFAAHQSFLIDRTREFFANEKLDLAPYLPSDFPPGSMIYGDPFTIELLKKVLKEQ